MYRTSDPILADDLRQFLLDLREKHHHIFTFLAHISITAFRILVDDGPRKPIDKITLGQFLDKADTFQPRQTLFTVKYRTYLFRDDRYDFAIDMDMERYDIPFRGEMQATCVSPQQLDELVENFEGILAYYMREALYHGCPFCFNAVFCDLFGFTSADVEALRSMTSRCHGKLVKEFSEEYLQLGGILGAPEVLDPRRNEIRIFDPEEQA